MRGSVRRRIFKLRFGGSAWPWVFLFVPLSVTGDPFFFQQDQAEPGSQNELGSFGAFCFLPARDSGVFVPRSASAAFFLRPSDSVALGSKCRDRCTAVDRPGSRATRSKLAGVRRIHLSLIRYFLYYRVHAGRVEVLAFWHSSRGKSPAL